MPEMMTSQTYDPSQLPQLPKLQDLIGPGPVSGSEQNIYKLLQAPQGRMTDMLPSISQLLMGQTAPAVQSVREGARQTAATMQSEAMKRGITGSDIELSNIRGAYEEGELQAGQMISQQASALAQYIMQAYGLDIAANREQFVTLAQAIGQEISSYRDYISGIQQGERASNIAAKQGKMSLYGAGIVAAGMLGGGALA